MARKMKLPKVVTYVKLSDGREVLYDDMPDEDKDTLAKSITNRMSQALSDYYAMHPEEFDLIDGKLKKKG